MHDLSSFRLRRFGLVCAAAVTLGALAGEPAYGHRTTPTVAKGGITLTIWYESQAPGYAAGLKAITAAFNKSHPGITVVPVGKATTALADQEPLALQTSAGPDIAESWQLGYGTLGRMVKDKSLLPLDSYAKQYGWASREGPSLLDSARFTPDGSTWGKGNLYALPWAGGALGVFYNKQKLAALGVGVPKTFQQFLSDLALAKKAGQVPIMLGDAQGFPLLHDFQEFADTYGGGRSWQNFVYGIGHGTQKFSDPANLSGAQIVAKLGAAGDFNSDHAGTQLLDMVNRFANGEGVFMLTGTWFAPNVQKIMKSNVGFFAMPGSNGSAPLTNGSATPFGISSHSKNPAAAAEFLNYLISPAAVDLFIKNGGFSALPVSVSQMKTIGVSPTSAIGDGYTMFANLLKVGSLLPFLDWSTPSMLQTADGALEELVAGKTTPQGFVTAVQNDYNQYWKQG
jgi:raffinose/stachyose/melibiose transport system substrate-binding protein